MNAGETKLSTFLKVVFWIVAANSLGATILLLLFSTQTETYFFWNITPPINAMLMGMVYLLAAGVVTYAALHGTWEMSRVIAVMGFVLSALFFIVTLVHIDRFVPGTKLYYWLSVYFLFAVLVALLYARYERAGANWQVIDRPIRPVTRSLALITGSGMLVVAVLGLLFPTLLVRVWPWTIAPLMMRILLSCLLALAVSNLWFLIEKDWGRLQIVGYILIATPILIFFVLLLNPIELSGSSVNLTIFSVLFALIGLTGIFMLWGQRR
jgi:hypothetical protein